MKTVMLLNGGPLAESQNVDERGYILRHKLVYGLEDSDLAALDRALALSEKVMACAVGANLPQEAFQLALSHGAQSALHVGAADWPEQPATQPAALALWTALGNDFDLLITSDVGEQANIAAQLAALAGIPFFNGLLNVERQGPKLRLLRKLEKGRRQVILAEPPLVLALLPRYSYTAPPKLATQIAAEENPLEQYHVSYYDCLRRSGCKEIPPWQPQALNPAAHKSDTSLNNLPAKHRLNHLLQGTAKARGGRRIKGSPEECAQAIVSQLLQEGLITEK